MKVGDKVIFVGVKDGSSDSMQLDDLKPMTVVKIISYYDKLKFPYTIGYNGLTYPVRKDEIKPLRTLKLERILKNTI